MQRRQLSLIVTLCLLVSFFCNASANAGQSAKDDAGGLPVMLEKSGYPYTKVANGIWEIPATGKNVKKFAIRVIAADDILLVTAVVANRGELKMSEAILTRLIELNHRFDSAKLALSKDALYARIDIHMRLVDDTELKYLVNQMANVVDETYPQIKQFIATEK